MVAVALGNFDGVHLAHRAVLQNAAQYDKSVCLLFSRHPREVLTGKAPARLLTKEQTERKIKACGIARCHYVDFEQVKEDTPARFFSDILVGELHADVICCGYNYTFGRQRSGDVQTLRALCEQAGITLLVSPEMDYEGESISSSRIRACIRAGNIEAANAMLGESFFYESEIVEGKKLGRTLGFPTINQFLDESLVKPLSGVYASEVIIEGKHYRGLTNIGDNPTIGGEAFRSETYVFGLAREVYGLLASVALTRFIREEKRFESTAQLKAQVLGDIERAKENV